MKLISYIPIINYVIIQELQFNFYYFIRQIALKMANFYTIYQSKIDLI